MHPEPLIYSLFGLVIGSFLNVCIYRIPLGKSVVFPGSSCPGCGKPIRPYDNIPILSYLLLRGKCRSCGTSISIQYPLVELLTGASFYACAATWGFASPTYVNTLLLSIVIILIFTDFHHQILPNVLTLPGIIAGILLSPFQSVSFYSFDILSLKAASVLWPHDPKAALPWTGSLVGAIIGGGMLLVVAWAYEKLRKRQGLGMGDVKMVAMVGAFLGFPLAILTILLGSLLGTLVGVFLMLFRNANLQTKLALGVFLGISTAICIFFGLPFLHWYWNIAR
jgi:leader peptidase (prepilin peptidase) / N-methyltransferase